MEIICRAKTTTWHPGYRRIYSCNIEKTDLRLVGTETIGFHLTHEEPEKTDEDVEAVVIHDSKVYKIPKNFEEIFKNVRILCVKQCNLDKIDRRDLQNFSCLKEIWMPNNKLKLLPDNLFIDHPEIQKLSFSNNQISVIGDRILEPIEDLRYANFNKNVTIDVTFNADNDNIDLDELKEIIKNNCKGINRSIFKQKKRNFDFIRNSLDAHKHLSVTTSVSTEVMSSYTETTVQNASVNQTNTYQRTVFRRRQFFTSTSSINSELSYQRAHNVVHRRRYQETPKGRPKVRKSNQNTQTEQSKFSDDLNVFMMRDSFKDFSISNREKTYNVHRFVMAARSPVICGMIKKNPMLRGINFANAKDNIIEHLLEYVYDDQLPEVDEFGDFLRIFDLSKKLELADLVEYAKKNILNKVTTDNAIECLEIGLKHKDVDVMNKGVEIVQKMLPQKKFKSSLVEDSEKMTKMIKELKIMKKTIDEATLKFNQLSFFESKTALEKY